MTKNFAFHDLDAKDFPFDIEFFIRDDEGASHVIKRDRIDGPGAYQVEPLQKAWGRPVGVRLTFADGQVTVVEPQDPQ